MKPRLAERIEAEQALRGKSYEEANWARLSPKFREAHNRLRKMKGLEPIPPPKVDLYMAPPKQQQIKPVNLNTAETKDAVAGFLGPVMAGRGEGFTINGEDPGTYDVTPRPKRRPAQQSEGFTINGKRF